MRSLFVLFAFVSGGGLAFQAAINTGLGKRSGQPVWAALASFVVGTIFLALIVAAQHGWPAMSVVSAMPWYLWMGGILGALYVAATIVVAPRIGVAALIGVAIAGQMAASLAIDKFGWLGLAVRPLGVGRIVGAVLVVTGVFLIRRF